MTVAAMAEPESLKEEGNKYFRSGQYEDALRCYTQALELGSLNDSEKAIIFKNRSACRLKLNDHEAAVSDASACKFFNVTFLIVSSFALLHHV